MKRLPGVLRGLREGSGRWFIRTCPPLWGGPGRDEVKMLRARIPYPNGPRDASGTLCSRCTRREGLVGSCPVA